VAILRACFAYDFATMKKRNKGLDTVAIVGTGNVARVLAVALLNAGVRVNEIVTRDSEESKKKGQKLARYLMARTSTVRDAKLDAKTVWLCVADNAIAEVAEALAKLPVSWKRKVVLHASGALTAAELAALKKKGAAVASLHPMNTFLPTSSYDLKGTPFGAEGDVAAIKLGRRLARKVSGGAPVYEIRAEDKPLYHALGSFTSPLNISTLNVAERIAISIGIYDPKQLMHAILIRTVENFIANGSAGAFSGPIRRGDVATIRTHLAALQKVPGAREVYVALAKNAIDHLPAKNQAEIRALLNDPKK
jgi:predicted short-subunit dehydrogenase-like oxidoreductase (DUF2520 family)